MAAPQPSLGYSWRDSLINPMLITAYRYLSDPKFTGSLVMSRKVPLYDTRRHMHYSSHVLDSLNRKWTVAKEIALMKAVKWGRLNVHRGWKAVSSGLFLEQKTSIWMEWLWLVKKKIITRYWHQPKRSRPWDITKAGTVIFTY